MRCNFAVAVVEPDRHIHHARHRVNQTRLAHCSRTHDYSRDSRIGELLCVVEAAHAPAGLHACTVADRSCNRAHDRPVVAVAFGRVEVDDVQPLRTIVDELLGGLERVGAVHALAGEVALFEAHDSPAAQVDGGIQLHVTHFASLRSRARDGEACCVDKVAQERQPVDRRLLGVELHGEEVSSSHCGRHVASVLRGGDDA